MSRPAVTFGELLTRVAGVVVAGDLEGNIRAIPLHVQGYGEVVSVDLSGGLITLIADRGRPSRVRRVLDWPGESTS